MPRTSTTPSSAVAVGRKLADFSLPSTTGEVFSLAEHRGQPVVLYFYPKDMTSGCTLESQQFRDLHAKFKRLKAVVLGISRDTIKSHERFRDKEQLPFHLLSDSEELLCKRFDVIREKNMYGKKVMGIERSTFLIDGEGVLRQEWRKVKVEGHAEAVLEALRALD